MNKDDFLNSLDLPCDDLVSHIPELHKGLWELGSMPEYIIELITRNNLGHLKHVVDLGCGKGAVLVKLAMHFDINALGIDLVDSFIEEANKYAKEFGVADKVHFKAENLVSTIKSTSKQDLVIYGYDSEILGDLAHTLSHLRTCLTHSGYLILEFMFAEQTSKDVLSESEMKKAIERSGFLMIDRINWDKDVQKQINAKNTEIIKSNIERLIAQYPDKEEIFQEYLHDQIVECDELETIYTCTTQLLKAL